MNYGKNILKEGPFLQGSPKCISFGGFIVMFNYRKTYH